MRNLFITLSLIVMCHIPSFSQKAGNALYIIKDGKLQSGVEVVDRPNNLVMEQGDGFVSFKKKSMRQQNIFFKFALKKCYNIKNMNLVVEYQLPETALCDANHKSNMILNFCAEKMAPTLMFCAYSLNRNMCSNIYIDGKFDERTAKDFVTYEGFAYVADSVWVNSFELAYMDRWEWRESEMDSIPGVLKVKNLYYAKPDSEKTPFFSTKFDAPNTWDKTWNADKFYQNGAILTCSNPRHPKDIKMLYMNQPENWTGSDGSAYLSSELFHGLLVKSAYNYRHYRITDKDTMFLKNILLPSGVKKINLECLLRAEKLVENTPSETIPMFVTFDKGKTMVRLFDDTIPAIYTKFERDIDVPAGAKYMDLVFAQASKASYIVDNLIIASLKTSQSKPKKSTTPSNGKK